MKPISRLYIFVMACFMCAITANQAYAITYYYPSGAVYESLFTTAPSSYPDQYCSAWYIGTANAAWPEPLESCWDGDIWKDYVFTGMDGSNYTYVIYKYGHSTTEGCNSDMDGDGVLNENDLDPNDPNVTGEPTDTDEDGLPDDLDPYPNDANEMLWKVVASQVDENGSYTYMLIQTREGDYFTYGEEDPNKTTFYEIGGDYYGTQDLVNILSGPGMSEIEEKTSGQGPVTEVPGGTTYEPGEYGTGNDNTGNSTETDYLSDIVENTKQNLQNQSEMGQGLKAISDSLDTLNQQTTIQGQETQSVLEGIKENLEGDYSSLEGLEAEIDNKVTSFQTEANDALSLEDAPAEQQARGDMTEKLNTIKDSVDITPLTGTTVTTIGDCSFSWNYQGKEIEFTICAYASALQTFGTVMQMLMGLQCLLIVFEKRG